MDIQPPNALCGFVSIGRNEGDRLKVGLRAIKHLCPESPVVYVDSGSDDSSVAFAQSLGIHTVELDLSIPFTAARARNAGFKVLMSIAPDLEFVQFMDGDCELLPGWIEAATATLKQDQKNGIVSGRRSERYPDATIYNQLIDIEWNTAVGEALAVLGDMCVKVEIFKSIQGFNESIISAEDDDFCIRARRADYKVFRIDADMSKHDANITRLSQWYKRSKRGGHGYANIFHLHGSDPDRYFRRELKSVLFWGGAVPVGFLLFLFIWPPMALLILVGYMSFVAKTVLRLKRNGYPLRVALAYGLLIFSGKIPELMGMFHYLKNYFLSRNHELIEYK